MDQIQKKSFAAAYVKLALKFEYTVGETSSFDAFDS